MKLNSKKEYSIIISCFLSVVLLIPNISFADFIPGQCSKDGYSIITINGINTTNDEAKANMIAINKKVGEFSNNQKVEYQYLLNQTHMAGIKDVVDVFIQDFFKTQSDYDLIEMLRDASTKIMTQKVLLVGHSQGNFYANNFYKTIVDKVGGIPEKSIRVYGVASPANNVAGNPLPQDHDYTTSDTDVVINTFRALPTTSNVLKSNVHIGLTNSEDKLGHNFAKVYLKYQADKIVSDVQHSLNLLRTNDIQVENQPCLEKPKLTLWHQMSGEALAYLDHPIDTTKDSIVYIALGVSNGVRSITSGIASLFKNNNLVMNSPAAAVVAVSEKPQIVSNTKEEEKTPVVVVKEEPKQNIVKQLEPEIKKEAEIVQVRAPKIENEIVSSLYIPTPSVAGGIRGSGQRSIPTPPDTTPPVITILGNNPETIEFGSIYSDAGATAIDDKDGDIGANIVMVNSVNTGVAGAYIVTYNIADANANTAIEITRIVNVLAPPVTYLESSQLSLPVSISRARFYYCADVSSGVANLFTFGSIFYVSAGGVNLDTIGVRGVAGSGTVTSGSLKVYPFNSTSAFSFGAGMTLPLGALIATSDTFNPSTWSSVPDAGTNPADFPYVYINFPHVFLPEGTYFMTFGDCATPTSDYFGVKGSGRGLTQGFQVLFNFVSFGTLSWHHLGGFSFDYIINSATR